MDIESIAVERINREINKYDCLKSVISKNDKTPIWDGEIFIYKENSKYQSNTEFDGKINVQIKGHKVKKLKKGNSKYPIGIEYLKAYQKIKSGTLLFVVEMIDSEQTQIYYANLLPVDLKEIFDRIGNNKKQVSIDIKPIKEKSSSSIKMICQNFLKNANEQMNIPIKNVDEIKDIEHINFTIIGERNYIEDYVINNDIYTYAIEKGTNRKFALPKIKNVHAFEKIKSDIEINGKKYYDKFTRIKNRDEEYCLIGKSTKIFLNENKVNFKIEGNIYERIQDSKFILDLLKFKELKIGDVEGAIKFEIPKRRKESYIQNIKKDLMDLNEIKNIFDKFKINFDVDLKKLDEKSCINLERFIKLNNENKIDEISESCVQFIDIDKYRIAFLVLEEANQKITVYNYFENLDDIIEVYYLDENEKQVRISPYMNLTTDNLITFSNLNLEVIKNSFTDEMYSIETCERYNLFLLEIIKAYDRTKDDKWLNFAEFLINKIINSNTNSIFYINQLQIYKRYRKLTLEEKSQLYKIKEEEKENYMVLSGIAILLENWSDYEMYFSKLTEEERKQFIEFPIYNLRGK